MLPKNYSQNKNNKNSESKETAGVILIIVFSFLLFCNLLGPLVLGGIGAAIKNVSMGLMGYFSYPFYLYFLILGVLMMQGKKMAVKRKYAVALVLLFLTIVSIIQLATTSGYLYSFENYVDYVYHGQTIGGLILGMIVFGLATLLTTVGAYVVLGFIVAGAFLLVAGFFDKFLSGNVKKRKVKTKENTFDVQKNKVFKSETPKLYIDTISSGGDQQYSQQNMSFDGLPQDRSFTNPSAYNNEYSRNAALEAGVTAMRQEQDEAYEDLKRKADARKILFGDTEEYKKEAFGSSDSATSTGGYGSGYSSSSFSGYDTSFSPYYGSASSGGASSYGSSSSSMSDVVPIPPEKTVDYNYFGSAIINGDLLKASAPEQAKPNANSFSMDEIKSSFTTETFGYNSEYNQQFINESAQNDEFSANNTTQSVSRPPIINGDMINKPGGEVSQNATVYQEENAKPEFPEFKPGPIIRGSNGSVISFGDAKPETEAQKEVAKPEPESVEGTQVSPVDNQPPAAINQNSFERIESQSQTNDFYLPEFDLEGSDQPEIDTSKYLEENVFTASDVQNQQDSFSDYNDNECEYADDVEEEIPVIELTAGSQEQASVVSDQSDYDDEAIDDVAEYEALLLQENDSEALIDDSFDFEEIDDAQSGEEQLEKYEAEHGHPKFEGVTEQESKALNSRFEETSSFKIEDEVIDQSENAKFNLQQESTPAPIVNAQPKTPPVVAPVISVADVTAPVKPKVQDVKPVEKVEEKPKRKKPYKYVRPSLDLLTTQSTGNQIDSSVLQEKSKLLEETLTNLGIDATVESITVGPAVTRYELNMPVGMSVRRIEGKQADIQYGLACTGHIRVESPIPGKRAVGVEVPNDKVALVALRDIIDSKEFNSSPSPLTVSLGKDIQGKVMTACIDKMPHMLIAGTTGSGKSACLNSIIISILYKASPDEVKLILVDPKCVEFAAYSGIPHMMIKDAITEPAQVLNAFKWLREEMDRRYKVLQGNRVRNIGEYNKLQSVKDGELDKLPYIVVIVDEFADLMLSSGGSNRRRELEGMISSIAGKARAAGIHMILATQRPSADVITGTIKSNLPACIAFAVSNATNSRIILDKTGAEALVGKGDMLFAPQDRPDGVRIQGSFVDNPEINSITDFVRENNISEYDGEFEKAISVSEEAEESVDAEGDASANSEYDKDLVDIVKAVMVSGQASGAMIQRRFGIGYMRAAKIIDQMEELKFIGPSNGSRAREVFITKERYEEFFGVKFDD